MKKTFLLSILIGLILLLVACQNETPPTTFRTSFSYMSTSINLQIVGGTQAEFDEINHEVDQIFSDYHQLTDNFTAYPGITNIYTINDTIAKSSNVTETLEIDERLFQILQLAQSVQSETNGHYNASIGLIVDQWKALIDLSVQTEAKVTSADVEAVYHNVGLIEVLDEPFTLTSQDSKYSISIHQGAKLDLGAIAKGYVTEVVNQYLLSRGITQFLLSSGSSSISVGHKETEDGYYRIALTNPLNIIQSYGVVSIKDTSITTSGSYLQFAYDESNNKYHHIISPLTKAPVNLYHTLTIIGRDAGLMDAYSTALFTMELADIEAFAEMKNLEIFIFSIDGEIIRINPMSPFEER